MFCKHCGKEISKKDTFCPSCGKSATSKDRINKKSRFGLIATIVLLVALAVLIGIYVFRIFNGYYDYLTDDYDYYGYSDVSALLYELDPYIQPLGYYDDPVIFDSFDVSDEEWFSHLYYYEDANLSDVADVGSQFPNQAEILSSVVKVVCEDVDYYYYGSGTNFDGAGYVLTNQHVIEDADGRCVIGFPDPKSGLIREAYWATPIVDDENVTGHDLAYLSVEEPVFDDDYNVYGYYSRMNEGTFPYFEITEDCYTTPIQLGSRLYVVGYPPLSGGALTITDGLVSSLYSQDGYIVTSAKIISGNSGGLAIDELGCYIGVPTAVYYEEGDEYLGEIIDAEFVDEFDDAVADDIDEYLYWQ